MIAGRPITVERLQRLGQRMFLVALAAVALAERPLRVRALGAARRAAMAFCAFGLVLVAVLTS